MLDEEQTFGGSHRKGTENRVIPASIGNAPSEDCFMKDF